MVLLRNQILCDLVSWSDGTLELHRVAAMVCLVKRKDNSCGKRTTHDKAESTSTIGVTGISWPFSSLALVTLKAESTQAVTMNNVTSTK